MKRTLAAAAIYASTVLSAPAFAQDAPPPAPRHEGTVLQITAEAQTRSTPDLAVISAGVMTSAASAEAAMQDNAKHMTAVFDALKKAGIDTNDIQSQGINVNPQYVYKENEAPTVSSYQANNNVTVRLHKMEKIGEVIDALVKQGANQINGPTFSVEDSDKVLDAARTEALKKARARAELYATAAGLTVGRILNISEQNFDNAPPVRPMMMKAMASDAVATPVASGQVDMGVSVNVTFELVAKNP